MKLRHIFCLSSLWLFASLLSSCMETVLVSNNETPYLEVETKVLNFAEEASSQLVSVSSNMNWTAYILDSGGDWLSTEVGSEGLTVSATENENKDVRQASIVVSAESLSDTISVAQLGYGKSILLSTEAVAVKALGEEFTLDVTTNVEYEVVLVENTTWLSQVGFSSTSIGSIIISSSVTFNAENNDSDEKRETYIVFRDLDQSSDVEEVVVTVTQYGLTDYEVGDISEVPDDIKVEIMSAEASSESTGGLIAKSYDGSYSTMYHSNWSNSGSDYFPITLCYYFEEGTEIDYFIYYPRQDGNSNGKFKEVNLYYRIGSGDWTFWKLYDFAGSSFKKKVQFDETLTNVTGIKFEVLSGAGTGQGFASCAEMEFYKVDTDNFDYSTLFTDQTCSELKAGVTEEDIKACSNPIFRNIAWYMYNGKYESDFRIASYTPRPNPDTQASANKTSTYSRLDNPTGISVEAGDTLIVLAELHGQSMNLRVQNLNKSGGDGYGGQTYAITSGMNKLNITNEGLVYLMYNNDNYESLPDVKLHFINGTVNGYYDSQNPDHDWETLLANASNKYFDVLGAYAHLTFPTESFRSYTTDLKELIDAYDAIVYHEQLFMGLKKYNRMFGNRAYFHVMYTSYMYATSYRTAYNSSTMSSICNESKLTTSSIWGPAHEMGHINQTRPGLRWVGLVEVTNNIMAEYIQTTIFGNNSRLQVESNGNPNRYAKAWNNIMIPGLAHNLYSDVFCKLVPFWQLELYFGKVLGQTPLQQEDYGGFYPRVYEYVREHDDLSGIGKNQLEFVYNASVAGETNLIDFFEKWGFLTPVDSTVSSTSYVVTEDEVAELKARVEALNYPTLDIPLEYITDNNYETFKTKKSIVQGTSTRSGNTLTMENWENVIVYEVRNGNETGELIMCSEGKRTPSTTASFTVNGGWQDGYKVYAVAHDNTRMEVVFDD